MARKKISNKEFKRLEQEEFKEFKEQLEKIKGTIFCDYTSRKRRGSNTEYTHLNCYSRKGKAEMFMDRLVLRKKQKFQIDIEKEHPALRTSFVPREGLIDSLMGLIKPKRRK